MKVPLSIKNHYNALSDAYSPLQERVNDLFSRIKEARWHYESRLKPELSFAQKLETGRFDPHNLEDFFAATIVVENSTAIERAKRVILEHFDLLYTKPREPGITHKSAECFPFDDLRLYLRLKTAPEVPKNPINDLLFELQIRTFLQHAWSIATHDLIYKSARASWAKERIAYQIKAMLEHAELSIQQAEEFSKAPELAKTTSDKENIAKVISLIEGAWQSHELPADLNRLAENILNVCAATGITVEQLADVLKAEGEQGRGAKTLHLSPYCIVIQSLINHRAEGLTKKFWGRYSKLKLFLAPEIEVPEDFPLEVSNIIRIATKPVPAPAEGS